MVNKILDNLNVPSLPVDTIKPYELGKVFSQSDKIALVEAVNLVQSGGSTAPMVMPFSFRLPNKELWRLPIEPLLSVSGSNEIVKRTVSKSEGRGSIKERWAEGDYKITIQGSFVSDDMRVYPSQEVSKLREVMKQRSAVQITCELLQLLGINYVVIESYSLPFSKGENVQHYTIEAISDDSYNLFIDVK